MGIWSCFDWVTPSMNEWVLLLAIGLVTQVSQICMTRAIAFREIFNDNAAKVYRIYIMR